MSDNYDNKATEYGIEDDYPIFTERKRWVFLALPWTFTKYFIRKELLTTKRGLFKIIEDDCYMYKIVDVKLERSLFERMFGLGTVVCYTSDTTDKMLKLEHIFRSQEIKNHILECSEKMRLKRRTLNTLNLNSHVDDAMIDDID